MRKLIVGLASLLFVTSQAFGQPTPAETVVAHDAASCPDAFVRFGLTVDPANCATVSTCNEVVRADGVEPGDLVKCDRPPALNDDLVFQGCQVNANNFLTFYWYNPTGSGINQGSTVFHGVWFDRTNQGCRGVTRVFAPTKTPTSTPVNTATITSTPTNTPTP